MQRNLVVAVHGFLGQASDWETVKKELQVNENEAWDWITLDLFSPDSKWILPFDQFCQAVIAKYQDQLSAAAKKVFIGYSLGGRLGLHFLNEFSTAFDHYVFVSSHPGLLTVADKHIRKASDDEWAQQITDTNWNTFLMQWNSQDVFKDATIGPRRLRKDFNLDSLRSSLKLWSLGEQQDLRDQIKKYQDKITWVVGDEDRKFLTLADELKQKKILLSDSRIFSGHRILFENPKALSELLHQAR